MAHKGNDSQGNDDAMPMESGEEWKPAAQTDDDARAQFTDAEWDLFHKMLKVQEK
jgi:hypothetical protein